MQQAERRTRVADIITRKPDLSLTVHPSMMLTSNQRLHWADKARRTRQIRTIALLRARSNHVQPLEQATITAVIAPPDKRRSDAHNAQPAVKAAIDGIVDAGVLPDDDNKHLVELRFVADHPTNQGVWRIDLHIEEV